jgi:hypothetical protein
MIWKFAAFALVSVFPVLCAADGLTGLAWFLGSIGGLLMLPVFLDRR